METETESERSFMGRVRDAGHAAQALWLIFQMVGGAGMSVCRAVFAVIHIRLLRLLTGGKC